MINQTNQISTRFKKKIYLPAEWHVFKFSQLAIRRRESFDPKTSGQNFQCIELEHLNQGTGKIIGSINSISQQSNKSVFKIGDVLFGKLRPYLRKFALVDFNGVCSSEIWVLINKSPIIPEYLFLLVQTEKFLSFANRTSGTKMPRADWELVKKIDFPIPTKKEQQKISSIINKWDQAINLVEKQIKAKRKQKKALMQQLLSGKLRFPGFYEEWQGMELWSFLKMCLRKVKKPGAQYKRLGIRSHGKGTFITYVDDPEGISMTHLFKVKKGDLILNITFGWEGAIALVDEEGDGALVSHRFPTYEINEKFVLADYFKYLMLSPRFFYFLGVVSPGGAGRNRVLDKREFLKINVKLPSINEQKKISTLMVSLDDEISILSVLLQRYQNQKRGLMQKLLTGKIRVFHDKEEYDSK